ncbi:MAG: type II secretion system F family protein [Kiritimatiellia bacterium]
MSVSLTALVFAATFLAAFVFLVSVYRTLIGRALAERSDFQVLTPLRRLVSPVALVRIRFATAGVLACTAVLALLWGRVVSPWAVVALGGVGAAVGYRLPMVWFAWKLKKRREAFDGQVLNLTMGLFGGLRSGQALPQALAAVAQRVPDPMREELAVVLRENKLGLELSESLERLHARMPGEDLRLLVTSVRLTLQTGGSLSEVLERMVEMIRSRTEFYEKLKTMTAQGRFEAIAMSLAPLVVYALLRVIDPELMKPLTSTAAGWCAIGGIVLLVSIGFFIINKIVTIEV